MAERCRVEHYLKGQKRSRDSYPRKHGEVAKERRREVAEKLKRMRGWDNRTIIIAPKNVKWCI